MLWSGSVRWPGDVVSGLLASSNYLCMCLKLNEYNNGVPTANGILRDFGYMCWRRRIIEVRIRS